MGATSFESCNGWVGFTVDTMFVGIHGGEGVGGEGGSTAGFMKDESSGVHGMDRVRVLHVVSSYER